MTLLKTKPFVTEFTSHVQLISPKKEGIHNFFSSPYRIILIIIFSFLFFPHVFVVVKDLNLVMAYEVDPGSIIQSILSLFQNSYNMNAAYHSSFYGWAYYSISFFLLIPFYLAKVLNITKDFYYFFVALRFIFFVIGLASSLAFFEIAKRILKNNLLSFFASLLFVASPIIFPYFYTIHPDSTGLLFQFLGVLCLLIFKDGKASNYRWYTLGLFSLILSALSKQVFCYTSVVIIFLFYCVYCYHHNLSFFKFIFTRQFVRVIGLSVLLVIIVFFVINPYAFIQPKVFISNQTALLSGHTQGSILNIEAIKNSINFLKTVPIIYFSISLFPFTLLGAFLLERNQKENVFLYVFSTLSAIVYVLVISVSANLAYFQSGYFSPVYPYFILSVLIVPLYLIRKWNIKPVKILVLIPLVYFLFFNLVGDFSISIPKSYTRLMYKNSSIYKVYNYIEEAIPNKSRIAHDHFVALPSDKEIIGCHFWQGCGTDYIEEFQPDYVIFDQNWTFNGVHLPTQRLLKYVTDHHFILLDTIDNVSIWKKPPK